MLSLCTRFHSTKHTHTHTHTLSSDVCSFVIYGMSFNPASLLLVATTVVGEWRRVVLLIYRVLGWPRFGLGANCWCVRGRRCILMTSRLFDLWRHSSPCTTQGRIRVVFGCRRWAASVSIRLCLCCRHECVFFYTADPRDTEHRLRIYQLQLPKNALRFTVFARIRLFMMKFVRHSGRHKYNTVQENKS